MSNHPPDEALTPFDPADYLDTPAAAAFYLQAAMESDDPAHIASAMEDVDQSIGGRAIFGARG